MATNHEGISVLDCAQGHPPRGMIQVVVRFSLKSSGLRMQILNNYVSPLLDSPHWNHATAPVHFVFRKKSGNAAEVQKIRVVNGFWHFYESYEWNTSLGVGIHDWMKNALQYAFGIFWMLLVSTCVHPLETKQATVLLEGSVSIPQTIEMAPSPMAPGYRPVDRLAEPAFPWPMKLSCRFWNSVQQKPQLWSNKNLAWLRSLLACDIPSSSAGNSSSWGHPQWCVADSIKPRVSRLYLSCSF